MEAVADVTAETVVGMFGKVPALGDFVRRRLPLSFVEPWDDWLRQAMAESRSRLASAWLNAYLTSPLWRFALPAGVCGPHCVLGVLMPSVDAANRHFPLTIAALLANSQNLLRLMAFNQPWCAAAEHLALFCLEASAAIEKIDAGLAVLGPPKDEDQPTTGQWEKLSPRSAGGFGWRFADCASATLAGDLYPAMLDDCLAATSGCYSLWWTAGSDDVPPSFLVYPGLPPVSDFAAMLSQRPADCGPSLLDPNETSACIPIAEE